MTNTQRKKETQFIQCNIISVVRALVAKW